MGVYRSFCYKVEDAFVKMITKKQDNHIIKEKVSTYRTKRVSEKKVELQKKV